VRIALGGRDEAAPELVPTPGATAASWARSLDESASFFLDVRGLRRREAGRRVGLHREAFFWLVAPDDQPVPPGGDNRLLPHDPSDRSRRKEPLPMVTSATARALPGRAPLPRCLSVIAAIMALASATACSRNIDMAGVDKSIREGIATQLGMAVASVDCPKEARTAKKGDVFTCTVSPEVGGRLTVTVTQNDDQGNIAWSVMKTEGLLDLRKVQVSVVDGVKAQAGAEATVDCGGRWKAIRPGEMFECKATSADGQTATVEVTTDDSEGNITWKVR
jgi:hypothetical protein